METKGFKAFQEGNNLYVEAYASVFGNVDSANEIVVKGAYANTLVNDFKRIRVADNHDLSEVTSIVGKLVDAKEDDYGLWVRIKISNTTKGKDIATLIEDEAVNELSVQYKTIGYFIENGIKYLTELKLVELGFVTRAANDKANVLTIERKEEQEPPVFDIAKLSDEDLTEKQKQINEEITKRILEKI